jgi:hypothetical protein
MSDISEEIAALEKAHARCLRELRRAFYVLILGHLSNRMKRVARRHGVHLYISDDEETCYSDDGEDWSSSCDDNDALEDDMTEIDRFVDEYGFLGERYVIEVRPDGTIRPDNFVSDIKELSDELQEAAGREFDWKWNW